MLNPEVKGRLAETMVTPAEALRAGGVEGTVLSMNASWHRTMENEKEKVSLASFAFLVVREGTPFQVEVEYENGSLKAHHQDMSAEMGNMAEEEQFASKVKLISDQQVLELLESNPRVETTMKKAKHLRLASLSFVIFDEAYEAPVWQVTLKNWPLTNFFRREKPITIEAMVEGIRGRVLGVRQVI